MFSLLCYTILYYNIDHILINCYLPWIKTNEPNGLTISTDINLFFSLKLTSIFMLFLYTYQLSYTYVYSKYVNKIAISLTCVYMKYLIDIITIPNMSIVEYEIKRTNMWAFTTPLMLQLYCDTNELTLSGINAQYHMLSIIPFIFIVPFGDNPYQTVYIACLYTPCLFFMKKMYEYRRLHFTYLFIFIWSIFMIINVLEVVGILNKTNANISFNLADTLCKFICNVVIAQYNEQELYHKENMDLQSVNFISYLMKCIKDYELNNQNMTPFCKDFVIYVNKKLMNRIPKTTDRLKIELLSKILPFDLDSDYISASNKTATNKQFDFICVLFMDIVNYTELAKKYNGDIIFKLLNTIYNHFDTIIKKYKYLQKIETIGDAYMVVGDIFRNELNHKDVIKEIILLGLDFIKEIKTITTPDKIPLCIRIGINMGSVNIGILGNEIPRLCVVGNAVNVASRLQSTADEDTIQISHHIYEQIEYIDFGMDIEFTKKENVFLKNIGSVTTYNI